MKLHLVLPLLVAVTGSIAVGGAFVGSACSSRRQQQRRQRAAQCLSVTHRSKSALLSSSVDANCGCDAVVYAGEPSERVKSLDLRQAVRKSSFYNVNGQLVTMDDVIGTPDDNKNEKSPVIAVFLRSLGCPLCQELILQWSRRVDELEQKGIKIVMVSIGLPEKGKQLIQHLGFQNGEKYLFVDPENALYDDLDLNRGVGRTFFNVNTPLSFLDRFTKQEGTKDLGEILAKWNKAFYIPPKRDQAFLQGGTFVFDASRTVFAHYDPSTASHASVEEVMDIATGLL